MEDREIISLIQGRNQTAIEEMDKKYRKYLYKIAMNILDNVDDADECINDTYMSAWTSIESKSPEDLQHYLARIVKNKALTLIEKNTAKKRGGGQVASALEELDELSAAIDGPEEAYLKKYDAKLIERFLDELPELDRRIFVGRYWYFEKISLIAKRLDVSTITVKSRIRSCNNKLKKYMINA